MSEQQPKPAEVKPVRKQRSDKQSSGSSGTFLAMVIALAAGGGSYYVWQQHLIAEQDRQALRQSIEQLLAVVEERDRAQQARIEQLRDHHHDTLEQRIGALEQSLPELSQQLSRQQRDFNLAEVDYLLRLAGQRLQLSRDIPTAIAALHQAREQLVNSSNGNFAEVVVQIGWAIDALQQLEQQDLAQITTRLEGLLSALDTLPVLLQEGPAQPQDEPPQPPASGADFSTRARYWGQMVWHDIKSLVTIRRNDGSTPVLVSAERRDLLRAQLRLKLEMARLGAAAHNQSLYESSLQEAAIWLARHFAGADSAVIAAQATLAELGKLSVDPELPSLQGLRQQLLSARPSSAVTTPPPAGESSLDLPATPVEQPVPPATLQPDAVEGLGSEQRP